MNKQEARRLLQKHRLDQCAPEEKAWVEQWYLELAGKEVLSQTNAEEQKKDVWRSVRSNISYGLKGSFYLGRRSWTIAATIIFLLGITFLFFQNRKWEHSVEPLRYSLIKTENGELRKITLLRHQDWPVQETSGLSDAYGFSVHHFSVDAGMVYQT